jgi:hypothetical protein
MSALTDLAAAASALKTAQATVSSVLTPGFLSELESILGIVLPIAQKLVNPTQHPLLSKIIADAILIVNEVPAA